MAAMGAEVRAVSVDQVGGCADTVPQRTLNANPGNLGAVVPTLAPGDLLQLAAGDYENGLFLHDLHGQAGNCILIQGPTTGPPARFLGCDCRNTVSLKDSSYLVVRNLEIVGQDALGNDTIGDGVKAESNSAATHHITLENLHIHWVDIGQQIVGINTKSRAWNWVIRANRIERAGTGIYLGNSDGEDEFVNGLIEHNVIVDTVGYNLQIKRQNGRETALGIPADGTTVIRHNVFSKAANASSGNDARPNLLVGQWPASGPGSDDDYLIYGNFFYQNETGFEALFQGTGNVIFYNNVLVNHLGPGVFIQLHEGGDPRRIRIFRNTLVASSTGISVSGVDPAFEQRVSANAVFANPPLSLHANVTAQDNVTDTAQNAGNYVTNPDGAVAGNVNRLDLYPLVGTLDGAGVPVDTTGISGFEDGNRDFNGASRPGHFRGAYAGQGTNPGWLPTLDFKPPFPPGDPQEIFSDGFESGDTLRWSSALP